MEVKKVIEEWLETFVLFGIVIAVLFAGYSAGRQYGYREGYHQGQSDALRHIYKIPYNEVK
jgi:flagellar biosynthesis/type III secretory pathway protein FliH